MHKNYYNNVFIELLDIGELLNISKASSSTTFDDKDSYAAINVNDGVSGNLQGSQVFVSKSEKHPWIQLKLREVRYISSVLVINRNEWGNRLRNVEVRVGFNELVPGIDSGIANLIEVEKNSQCSSYEGPGEDNERIVLQCERSIKGRFVSLHMTQEGILNIGDINIYGYIGNIMCKNARLKFATYFDLQ